MPLPDEQFDTWAHIGAQATAAATGQAIRAALTAPSSLVRYRDKAIYLQGSYKNSTNIRGDSDVDVVVQLREAFGYNVQKLNASELAAFHAAHPAAAYTFDQFRSDVVATLQAAFGDRVEPGNKAVLVRKGPGLVDADVVACQTYKHFGGTLFGTTVPHSIEGMQFFTQRDRRRIINWPRFHYEEGVKKNAATGTCYKPTVRIFKNLRNRLYDLGHLPLDSAPSYFVESLVFNVPNERFGISNRYSTLSALVWLFEEFQRSGFAQFVGGNGFIPLFGGGPDSWRPEQAYAFVDALIRACNA